MHCFSQIIKGICDKEKAENYWYKVRREEGLGPNTDVPHLKEIFLKGYFEGVAKQVKGNLESYKSRMFQECRC